MPEDSNIVNLEEVQSSGRPFLKNGTYTVRVIECTKQTSKKGNAMLVFTWEICSPESVTGADNKVVKITGLQAMDWIVIGLDLGLAKLKALHKTAGLPMTLNKANPDVKQYLGKAIKVSLTTEPTVVKDENTGEPVISDNGEPVTMNNYRIQRFLAADPEHTLTADAVAF